MPGATWSITIVPGATPGAPATFSPPNLLARPGDVVSWNNTTGATHQLWQFDGTGKPIPVPLGGSRWDPIPPQQQSPAWSVPAPAGQTIQYGCLLHGKQGVATEIGTITTTT
jgi:plastocyanin